MKQDTCVVIEHLRGQVAEISYVMLAAAHDIANSTGGKVKAVLLGRNAQNLAGDLSADQILYADHPALADFTSEAYLKVLASVLHDEQPRAALFGHTSIGMDIASGLSARLGLPLVTSVQKIRSDGKFVSQIYGGKIMVEGELPHPTALMTIIPGAYKPDQGRSMQSPQVTPVSIPTLDGLQMTLKNYMEPETSDIDITKESILIAVGRGIQNQDNIPLAEELAEALGGVVCASRPVVDQQWLPTSRLVGKSGKSVKPKVYLALGISGAPEHTEAITSSDVIIAINTDANAPIFNIAKYGVNADLLDVIPALIDQVRLARNG